jgi:hypothetical protein
MANMFTLQKGIGFDNKTSAFLQKCREGLILRLIKDKPNANM